MKFTHSILFFSLLAILCLSNELKAQPLLQWQRSIGGTASDYLEAIDAAGTNGYVLAGYSTSVNGDLNGNNGSFDFWVVRIDSLGALLWQRNLGGSNEDKAYSVKSTHDKGVIVTGSSFSNNGDVSGNHGSADLWLVKLDSLGNLQWQRSFGGTQQDLGRSVLQTADKGYLVCGVTLSNNGDVSGNHGLEDAWLIKTDSHGNLLWQKTLGGSQNDRLLSVMLPREGGITLAGGTYSSNGDVSLNKGSEDLWLVHTDSIGTLLWEKTYGGSSADNAFVVRQHTDSSYFLGGWTLSNDLDVSGNHGNRDAWLIHTDSLGNLIWNYCYGSTEADAFFALEITAAGDLLAGGLNTDNSGDISDNRGNWDFWIVNATTNGVINWKKSLGGLAYESCYGVLPTPDGGVLAGGFSSSNTGDVTGNRGSYDMWIAKLIPFPPVITTTDTLIICPGDSVVLSSNISSGNSWNTGETTATIIVKSSGVFFTTVGGFQSNSITVNLTTNKSDLNVDGAVNTSDFLFFSALFGTACGFCPEDLNLDGVINTSDYLIFSADFGKTCSAGQF